MKLIASGVTKSAASTRSPSFSRSSSSTRITILPALRSAMMSVVGLTAMGGSHPSGARVLEFAQALGVARERIHFDVDLHARRERVESRRGERMRDQVHFELRAVHRIDRQAYAIHGNRAFARDVPGEFARRIDYQSAVIAGRVESHHRADAVDVAGNQMPVYA